MKLAKRGIVTVVVLAILLILAVAMLYSHKDYGMEGKTFRVLVFHSYDENYYAYPEFDQAIADEFKKEELNVDIRNVYLNMAQPTNDASMPIKEIYKKMQEQMWTPDVIISEGDRSLEALLVHHGDTILTELTHKPTIAGAVRHPVWDELKNYSNIIVFKDPIDFATNIDLAQKLTGNNFVEVELDYFYQDSLIREDLRKAISRPPYVDNTDLHDYRLTEEDRNTIWKDSTMVIAVSAAEPHRNIAPGDTLHKGLDILQNVYTYAHRYPTLVLKRDVFSQNLASKTGRPQFTAINAGFADGKGTLLCGYFASYNTIANDVADCAAKICRGENYRSDNRQHQKHYYMDYAAMQILGMKYSDYDDEFTIIGAPFYVVHPFLTYGGAIAVIVLFGYLVVFCVTFIMRLRMSRAKELRNRLENELLMSQLALKGTDAMYIDNVNQLEEILLRVSQDSQSNVADIRQACTQLGTHLFKIHVAMYDDGVEDWWQLRLAVDKDSADNIFIRGLLRNINTLVEAEKEIEHAHNLALKAQEKKSLIRNMTSAINTPLDNILASADKLVKESHNLTETENTELCRSINSNNETLMGIINDILTFSRLESRKTEYVMSIHQARKICEEVYDEWNAKMPEGVKLLKNYGRPAATVYGDATHIRSIIDQFMSNAIKFTKHRTISIGYKQHLTKRITQLFVEDSGCGIPLDKRNAIFDAFYKNDNYVSGVGLGLNIATRLAQGMGGHVQVGSQEGVGSKFSVRLRTYAPEPADSDTTDTPDTAHPLADKP